MPNELFEVASPFDGDEVAEAVAEVVAEEAADARSLEINARRAQVEDAEGLRRARAL
ncbi:MAG: hypothetical protein ACK41C_07140 [Phenylobacterium sp.]|jgi:hypothetical protein|uniref:hypothetical protein n=1 Tax=Phenylobacterium sp. TaxID=1871053 RepID=UPI003919C5FE